MSDGAREIRVNDGLEVLRKELGHFRKDWIWFVVLGAVLTLCGLFAVAYPFASSLSVVVVLGATLLVGGVSLVISSVWTGHWSGFLLQLLVGLIYTVCGLLILDAPAESAVGITLMIAALFIVAGLFRIVAAISLRFPQWGWVLLNGIVGLLLGVMLLKQLPLSATWLIGTLFGIDLLLNGFTWLAIGIKVRSLPDDGPIETEAVASTS